MAFLFLRSPEGLLALVCLDEASSWIIIPEMAEISSKELRTLLRGGDDIYQVEKVLGQSNIQGPNLRTGPAWLVAK